MTGKINASFQIGKPTFTANGFTKTMDAVPFTKNDRTYVPVRFVAIAVGIPESNISYENDMVMITTGKGWLKLHPGNSTMETNNGSVNMDVPVLINNDRTYLPLRWICEALNLKVNWLNESQTIIIQN